MKNIRSGTIVNLKESDNVNRHIVLFTEEKDEDDIVWICPCEGSVSISDTKNMMEYHKLSGFKENEYAILTAVKSCSKKDLFPGMKVNERHLKNMADKYEVLTILSRGKKRELYDYINNRILESIKETMSDNKNNRKNEELPKVEFQLKYPEVNGDIYESHSEVIGNNYRKVLKSASI